MSRTEVQAPPTKASGIPWLGEVPAHWEVKRLRFSAPLSNERVEADGEETLPYVGMEHIESWTGKLLPLDDEFVPTGISNCMRPGHVLFGKLRPYLAKSWVADREGLCSTELMVLKPEHYQADFLRYLVLSDGFIKLVDSSTQGAKMPRADWEFVGNVPLPLPPLPEQRAIAAFLDERTARIDALVARKRRLVQLLKEKRQALITRAVTRGLDPQAKMKESGVPWLGEVPEGWEVKELKYMIGPMEQGWSPQCDNYPAEEGEWGVLKAGCVNGPSLNETENKRLPDHEQPIPSLEVKPGDILMSRANTVELIGSCGYVEKVRPRLILCDKLYRFHALPGVSDGRYLVYFLRSRAGRSYMEQNTSGASDSMQNIGQDVVLNIVMPCPPIEEQEAIVTYISEQTARLDGLVTKVEAAVERLQEYRTALISAAVTGKVLVPNT